MTVDVMIRKNILWSGENPIILLKDSPEAKETTAAGFFRVDYSPAGSGHAVFVMSDDLKVNNKKVFHCIADNEEIGAWVRNNTICQLPEFLNFDLSSIPIISGRFSSMGNTNNEWSECVSSDLGELRLTWSDLQTPFHLTVPVGAAETIKHEIQTCLYPARIAEVVLNGIKAKGSAQPDKIPAGSGGNISHSTAFLALSEVWYI
jgi:hypothetical protein